MIGAALELGGSGRVAFRYDGSGWGHDLGAILTVGKGKLVSERIAVSADMNARDRAAVDEVHARARQALERFSAQVWAKRRSKRR